MSYNVLIVDDSMVMRKIITKTLKECGLTIGKIYEAGTGDEGLTLIQENPVDLLLVDLHMPGMTGDVLVEKVREIPEKKEVSVIFISSETRSQRLEELIQGKIGFVHKPFTSEDLKGQLSHLGLC